MNKIKYATLCLNHTETDEPINAGDTCRGCTHLKAYTLAGMITCSSQHWDDKPNENPIVSGSKYLRNINLINGQTDIYAVLEAFNVTCPARQHAIKKLLCAGLRDKGNVLQDLNESGDAINRAIQLEQERENDEKIRSAGNTGYSNNC